MMCHFALLSVGSQPCTKASISMHHFAFLANGLSKFVLLRFWEFEYYNRIMKIYFNDVLIKN